MPGTPKPDQRLPRSRILRRRSDFDRVRTEGSRVQGRCLALNWLLRPGTPSLFAIIAPKLIGGAVERNRVKRWVREAYRRMQPHLPPGLVSIWIARRESPGSGADRIAREMQRIYQKAGLWTGDHPSL